LKELVSGITLKLQLGYILTFLMCKTPKKTSSSQCLFFLTLLQCNYPLLHFIVDWKLLI